jgi:DNA-binding MarR family transcriptional regulator
MAVTLDSWGLTLTEWLVIGCAIDAGPKGIKLSDVAKELGVEMPVITNLVKSAVASNWLIREVDEDDKRAKRIIITQFGIHEADKIEAELKGRTIKWLGDIDRDTLNGYYTVVASLADKSWT